MEHRIGFIGLGVMGQPMAANLLRAGRPLLVWNRSSDKCEPLRDIGAKVASSVQEVFERTQTVIIMLFDSAAIDKVVMRETADFPVMVRDHAVVNMSSVAPEFSRSLDRDIRIAGGRYLEAPVSGSRIPAEMGQLVAMTAGDQALAQEIRPLLAPMCHEQVFCGPVGNGLLMKLAVNLFLLVMANGLAEAVHFGDRNGLDRKQMQTVLNAGPMASSVSRVKLAKFIGDDHSPQAQIADALNSARLIHRAAQQSNATCDLIRVCMKQYEDTFNLGYGSQDMAAVIHSIEAQSRISHNSPPGSKEAE